MPRTTLQNETIREKRKQSIINAGAKLFAIRGYDNVTSDDIAAEAKCSHGLFYHYFQSKKDLLKTLLIHAKETFLHPIIESYNENEPGSEIFKRTVESVITSINSSEINCYIVFLVLTVPTFNKELNKSFDRKFLSFLMNIIENGQKEGKIISGDPKIIAANFYFMLLGMSYAKIRFQNHDEDNIYNKETFFSLFMNNLEEEGN